MNVNRCNRYCSGRQERQFDPPTFLECTRLRGTISMVLPVQSACVDCGAVIQPEHLAAAQFKADPAMVVNALHEQKARATKLPSVVGHSGTFQQLKLPSWYDTIGPVPRLPNNVRNRALQNVRDVEKRRGAIFHALGLTAENPTLTLTTLGIDVRLNDGIVIKLLHRYDSGHNQLIHLGVATLLRPRECWESEGKLRFLGLYRIEEELATQIVVVDSVERHLNSIHEIDDAPPADPSLSGREPIEKRVNKKRQGTCLHVAYN